MTIRWDDATRTLTLSVRDLVEAGPPSGHLVMEVAQTQKARMAAGRAAHVAWQDTQGASDASYQAEVTLQETLTVDGWTVMLQGRADGLTEEGGRTVVEEIKATALDSDRLAPTRAEDWPAWTAQLELYLWMLSRARHVEPVGRLVLVSLLDGSRHILGVVLDAARVEAFVLRRAGRLVRLRDARLRWYAQRRARRVPVPFSEWREGQQRITDAVRISLATGRRLLVQAPTGLGKTGAVMHGVLAYAMAHDKQVFWCTSRNTQQAGVIATLERFKAHGLELSWVGLRAKEKTCLNGVVSCRPDTCKFARNYYDKVEARRLVEAAIASGGLSPDHAMQIGGEHEVCPAQLMLDTSEHVDIVIGDVNYAFSPGGRLKRLFGDTTAQDWIVVVDEAHQLVERAREHASPRVDAERAREAARVLGPGFEVFADVAEGIAEQVRAVVKATPGPWNDGWAKAEVDKAPWRRLASRVDELALDYALLRARAGHTGADDPYLDVARQVLRFAGSSEDAGDESVPLVRDTPGSDAVRLLCLDPAPMLRPWMSALGGFIGCSATLAPHAFYRDLLGLPADTDRIEITSPFPPENRRVIIAPRVSTDWRDRSTDVPRIATLLSGALTKVPGNVAIYFSSFSMLDDVVGRLDLTGRELLAQRRGMDEPDRAAWMARMGQGRTPVVLAAVLGGIFAEGIDLPAGALSAVFVVGPALPPIGLERDLLRSYYEARFGQGFLYASLVPGMTRVVQAAGRLVRRPEDRGVIMLVGKRFRYREHADLLPSDWTPLTPDDPSAAIGDFWGEA